MIDRSPEHPPAIPWTPAEARQLVEALSSLNDDFFQRLTKMARQLGEARDQIQQRDSGPRPTFQESNLLLAEQDGWLTSALLSRPIPHCKLRSVVSGGIALDTASSQPHQIILISEQLPDLPGPMVVRSLLNEGVDALIVLFRRPGQKPGYATLMEEGKSIPLLPEFHDAVQLLAQIPELCEIYQKRNRERRYLLTFREENYELLRRYRELRQKLQRK